MSNVNGRDDNDLPVLWGVSHLDGLTPVQVKFAARRNIMVDTVTSIAFNPNINASVVPDNVKLAKATSSSTSGIFTANKTVRPWVVNAATGAVLVTTI